MQQPLILLSLARNSCHVRADTQVRPCELQKTLYQSTTEPSSAS